MTEPASEPIHRRTLDMININPLQTGGKLPAVARKTLMEWADGYSICDYCRGRLDKISTPALKEFIHHKLPEFTGMDQVRVTNGARESIFIVMHSICNRGDTIVADSNAHYTTHLAAERCGLQVAPVEHSGPPGYSIDPSRFRPAIEENDPSLVVLTWPDGKYGNYIDAKKVSKICSENDVPMLLNAAYSVGRRPVNGSDMGCSFLAASGHKSMASSGPIGLLGTTDEYADIVFRKSKNFEQKEVELLGCTARGSTVMTMMASFPHVKKRVENWGEEVEKARWFSTEMGKMGLVQMGQKPHRHDLMFFSTPPLYEISKTAKGGRYFLYKELKKRGIHGIKPGLTKFFKLSTYGVDRTDLRTVLVSFNEILREFSN